MNNLQTVEPNSYFAGYRRSVRDLASRLGKKVELVFDEDNVKILRDFADFIADPLLQLMRNAVVHGIETPGQRQAAGKDDCGRILMSVRNDGGAVTVRVEDDGSGIKAGDDAQEDLLSMITRPGFSTHPESSEWAGRGVGLDIVQSRIRSRGGRLELENRPGEGCCFRMIFDESPDEIKMLVTRTGEHTCAVRLGKDAVVFPVESEAVAEDGEFLSYKGLHLFTSAGRLKDVPRSNLQAVEINHLGASGLLVFEEALFESSYAETAVSEGFDVGAYCRELYIGGRKADFPILSNQVIMD